MVNYITLKQTISRIYTDFLPNADGCNIDFTPVGEVNNWECVDDPVSTPDEDTTYVYSSITDIQYDLYELPNHTTESGTINYIKVYARAKSHLYQQHADGIFKIILTDNDCTNIYKSSDKELTTDYVTYDNTWTENPRTSAAFTWADLNNLQIGVECSSPTVDNAVETEIHIIPNASGTYTEMNCGGTNYNNQTWSNQNETLKDLYNIPDQTLSGTILSVEIKWWGRVQESEGPTPPYSWGKTLIRTHSTDYYGTQTTLTPTVGCMSLSTVYTINPNTSAAWTWSEINALEIGCQIHCKDQVGQMAKKCHDTPTKYLRAIVTYMASVNPEIRTTQCYAKVNYSTHCTLTAPEEVSDDHSQNVKMFNLWNGERIVFGLSRGKWGLVFTGREWYSGACDKIICIRDLGLDDLPITISGLNNINWDGDWRILSWGWKIISECPEHIEWILELEKYE